MKEGIFGTITLICFLVIVGWVITFFITPFFWWAIMWDTPVPAWYNETLLWRWFCWCIVCLFVGYISMFIAWGTDKDGDGQIRKRYEDWSETPDQRDKKYYEDMGNSKKELEKYEAIAKKAREYKGHDK